MMHFSKKILTSVIALALVAGPLLPLIEESTPRAHAQVTATSEIPGSPLLTATLAIASADTATAGATGLQATIMNILNGLAWTVAKTAIQSMTRSIVTWINSGFEGSPAFATDLNRNLRGLGDTVARQFFKAIMEEGVVDSPFMEQVALGVGAAYYFNTSQDRIARRLQYTLNEYSRNDRAFLNGDFSQGGFNAWFQLWTEQSNNPIGAHYIAGQELAAQIESAQFERLQELMYGRGFLSWRGECRVRDETVLNEEEGCLKYETLTPGSVIERQLGITIESPLRQLELADSINEIVAALAVQMVTQVAGATGLLGTTRPSSGGGRSSLEQATDPNQYNTANIGQGLNQRVQRDRTNTATYQTNWQRVQTAARQADQALQSGGSCSGREERRALVTQTLRDSEAALSRASSALTALDGILSRMPQAGTSGTPTDLNITGNEYLALMSSDALPSVGDTAQSTNYAADTGSAQPGSLYSQLVRIARDCGTGGQGT